MNLEQLKRKFEEAFEIVDKKLSDEEIIRIYVRIKKIHSSNRTEAQIQEVITSVTGIDSFLLTEALDNSDINDIIDQIEDAIKNRK